MQGFMGKEDIPGIDKFIKATQFLDYLGTGEGAVLKPAMYKPISALSGARS